MSYPPYTPPPAGSCDGWQATVVSQMLDNVQASFNMSPESHSRHPMSTRSTPERHEDTTERDRWSSPEDQDKLLRSWSNRSHSPECSVVWIDTATDWSGGCMPPPTTCNFVEPESPAMDCGDDISVGQSSLDELDPESILHSIRRAFELTEPAQAVRKSAAHVLEHLWDQIGRDHWQLQDKGCRSAFGRMRRTYAKCEERLALEQILERTRSGCRSGWSQLLPNVAKEAMHATNAPASNDSMASPVLQRRFSKTPSPVPFCCFRGSPYDADNSPPSSPRSHMVSPSSRQCVQLHSWGQPESPEFL